MSRDRDDDLPLSPLAFEILLSLADEDRHGYAILMDTSARTGGAVRPHPGTLYRAIARMVDAGWIAELEERPDPSVDDSRRRYYQLTPSGRQVARVEARRLAAQVSAARTRNLLRPGLP